MRLHTTTWGFGWGLAMKVLLAGVLGFVLVTGEAKALIVDLDAYVDMAIVQEDLTTPLADGSWVYIVGSGDNINDGLLTWGGTNLVADSVLGDDVILARIQIPLNSITNSGTFFVTVPYESDDINYVYIRYFNTNSDPVTGMVWWGTSSMFQLGVTLGVATVQFDQNQQLAATNLNNFVVIPEPSTMNLFVMVAGLLWAMRSRMRWASDPGESSDGGSSAGV